MFPMSTIWGAYQNSGSPLFFAQLTRHFDCLFKANSTRLQPYEVEESNPYVSTLPPDCFLNLRLARVLHGHSSSMVPGGLLVMS